MKGVVGKCLGTMVDLKRSLVKEHGVGWWTANCDLRDRVIVETLGGYAMAAA